MISTKFLIRPFLPGIRSIFTSQCLYAEPLKKKRKIDPAIIKQREERRRKKLEKQIRRLEKNALQLKPVEELEFNVEHLENRGERERKRNVVAQEQENRALLVKAWARLKHEEKLCSFQIVDKLIASQNLALKELQLESEELYQAAIQLDVFLLPKMLKGPVATPPLDSTSYKSPDGDYIQNTKKWDKS